VYRCGNRKPDYRSLYAGLPEAAPNARCGWSRLELLRCRGRALDVRHRGRWAHRIARLGRRWTRRFLLLGPKLSEALPVVVVLRAQGSQLGLSLHQQRRLAGELRVDPRKLGLERVGDGLAGKGELLLLQFLLPAREV